MPEQSAAERKAAEAQLARLVTKFSPGQESLVAAARKWVRKRLPTAHEVAYEYKSWFVTSFSPSGKGYEGVLSIRGDADGIKLYFNPGNGLPDPEKLLKGTAQVRWIPLDAASTLARPAVAQLADAVIARSPVPFAATGNGSLTVKGK